MTRRVGVGAGWLVVIAWSVGGVAAAAPQTPARDTPLSATGTALAPATGTARLSGLVVTDDGAQPLRSAYVLLIGTTSGIVRVTSTDGDGRFGFVALPADRYTVGASKAPYLGAVAGAKRPARPGVTIALGDGQTISTLSIRLPMGAAIGGTIAEENGQPSVGAAVALQQWRPQGTERALVQVGLPISTDERGTYRFFGLPPGEYVVSAIRPTAPSARPLSTAAVDAALRPENVPPPATPVPPPARSSTSYYPGAVRPSDAQPIAVAAGEDRGNVDFVVRNVQTARIDGTVVNPDGNLPAGLSVLLSSAAGILQTVSLSQAAPDGRFFFPSVLPGPYRLLLTGSGPLAGRFATTELEVAGVDISGVQLTLRPALTFSGSVRMSGTTIPPALAGRRVPFRPLNGSPSGLAQPQVSPLTTTGTFTVSSIMPGRYLLGGPLALGPTSDTLSWALQSVVVDGTDVTDVPFEITDAAPKDVALVYTDQWQELSGRLQSASGTALSDVTIVVFPEDKAYWFQGSRRIVTTRPGTDGVFTVSSRGPTTLPAGHYLLATVTDIGRDEQFDPAFLSALVPGAVAIDLQPGDRKRQDLAVR